jgi:hypothetical protein
MIHTVVYVFCIKVIAIYLFLLYTSFFIYLNCALVEV